MSETGKISRHNEHLRPRRHLNEAGFTLIELMVVISIIGLMATVAVLTVPTGEQTLGEESERIAARISYVAEEALLSGAITGVSFQSDGYQFLKRRRGLWQPIDIGGASDAQPWPEDAIVDFYYEGEKLELARAAQNPNQIQPTIFFLPTGETQNVRIVMQRGRDARIIDIRASGDVSVKGDDAL